MQEAASLVQVQVQIFRTYSTPMHLAPIILTKMYLPKSPQPSVSGHNVAARTAPVVPCAATDYVRAYTYDSGHQPAYSILLALNTDERCHKHHFNPLTDCCEALCHRPREKALDGVKGE